VVSAVYYYYTCLYLYICRSGTYQWWGKAIFVYTHTRLCWWSASQQTRILCGMFTCLDLRDHYFLLFHFNIHYLLCFL